MVLHAVRWHSGVSYGSISLLSLNTNSLSPAASQGLRKFGIHTGIPEFSMFLRDLRNGLVQPPMSEMRTSKCRNEGRHGTGDGAMVPRLPSFHNARLLQGGLEAQLQSKKATEMSSSS